MSMLLSAKNIQVPKTKHKHFATDKARLYRWAATLAARTESRSNPQVRWLLKTRRISKKMAEVVKNQRIECARARLQEARDEFGEAILAPLQRIATEYVKVLPGEPGYEKADICSNPARYTGEWTFTTGSMAFSNPRKRKVLESACFFEGKKP